MRITGDRAATIIPEYNRDRVNFSYEVKKVIPKSDNLLFDVAE
jgi:hypothetical protein